MPCGDDDAADVGEGVRAGQRRRHPVRARGEQRRPDDREHGVQGRDDELDQERGASVLEGVVAAEDQVLHRERHQPDREEDERPADQRAALAEGHLADRHTEGEEDEGDGYEGGDRQAYRLRELPRRVGQLAARDHARQRRQDRGREADGDQRVGKDPQEVGVVVRGHAGARAAGGGRGGEVGHHDERELVHGDEAERPLGEVERLAEAGVAQVEARPVREADLAHERDEDSGLYGDAEDRADAQEQCLPGREGLAVVRVKTPHGGVREEEPDLYDVVRDRRPHHRAERVAGVEHLRAEEERAEEEDLWQAERREQDHRLVVRGDVGRVPLGAGVDPRDERRCGDEHHGRDQDDKHERGHDPVRVGLAAVCVVLRGAHDLGHQHGVEGAAGEEDVQAVRHRRGQREDVGLARVRTDQKASQDHSYQAQQTGCDRAGGHDRGG